MTEQAGPAPVQRIERGQDIEDEVVEVIAHTRWSVGRQPVAGKIDRDQVESVQVRGQRKVAVGVVQPAMKREHANRPALPTQASEFAERLGVPVPATFDLGGFPLNPRELPSLPYPVVVKGQQGSGSSNVRFADGPENLVRGFREVWELESDLEGGPSVQEYVAGPGYLVHLLYWQGEPYAAVCHRKDREYPVGGGVTAAATTVHEPELLAAALRIAGALEWHGLVKMDFLHDPATGAFKFVEIDPRVSASLDIARVAGVDQVAMLADLVEGKAVKPNLSFRAGVRYRWLFPRDLLAGIANPGAYLRLLPDILSPRVHFDLGPSDWWPFFYQVGRFVQERKYLDRDIRAKARAARVIRAVYEARISGESERARNGSV